MYLAYKKIGFIVFFCLSLVFISAFMFEKKPIKLIFDQKGVYVVEINSDYFGENSEVYVSDTLEHVEDIARKNNAKIAINTGFFDPLNSKTISYILKEDKIIANPLENERLTSNHSLNPYFEQVLNRSEFRVLECKNKINFDIVPHNQSTPNNCRIKYSIQAGPMLLPELRLQEEFFVLEKEGKIIKQSAGALRKHARSAIGIRKNKIILVVVEKEHGLSLEELAFLMKKLKLEKAMAFDGGSSTALYLNTANKKKFSIHSGKENSARKVKSVLFIK